MPDGKGVKLFLNDIRPADVMTITYDLSDTDGHALKGTVQNTIYALSADEKSL
jgi:hypothetical protein